MLVKLIDMESSVGKELTFVKRMIIWLMLGSELEMDLQVETINECPPLSTLLHSSTTSSNGFPAIQCVDLSKELRSAGVEEPVELPKGPLSVEIATRAARVAHEATINLWIASRSAAAADGALYTSIKRQSLIDTDADSHLSAPHYDDTSVTTWVSLTPGEISLARGGRPMLLTDNSKSPPLPWWHRMLGLPRFIKLPFDYTSTSVYGTKSLYSGWLKNPASPALILDALWYHRPGMKFGQTLLWTSDVLHLAMPPPSSSRSSTTPPQDQRRVAVSVFTDFTEDPTEAVTGGGSQWRLVAGGTGDGDGRGGAATQGSAAGGEL